ncbi:MAG: phospholipid ABC transporter ATP-binding protein MlaF [Gammaproteobacteria bacterium]|nr:ABC transporter ATP-binding protein [Gammaproteobacteria bacterium]PCH64645.1 MAG: phospholipid ABC transporter ATP-binding protein MlaF [Gammaproteobacteria bacterium]
MSSDSILTIKNLQFSYGARIIADGMDIDIERGKITTIMGPSGTGKTTLLRMIGGQVRPHAGEVRYEGKNIPDLNKDALLAARKSMGLLFQASALFTGLSVFDNVAFPIREHTQLSEQMVSHLVLSKLEAVGLRGAAELMPGELSGGMARRVALARAIALDPRLMMYDEPFVGQDPITMSVITRLIKLLNDSLGMTSIIVSHDVHDAMAISDFVYLIAEGKVIASGTPEELRQSESPWARQFLRAEPDGPVSFQYPATDYQTDLFASVE